MRSLGLLVIAFFSFTTPVQADGLRCGTRLVVIGDSVTRLTTACGEPDRTWSARIDIGRRGDGQIVKVKQWVYDRGSRRDMIVSILDGRVVKIERS